MQALHSVNRENGERMTAKEVLERFCVLSERVAEKIYKNTESADCFCGAKPITEDFKFSCEVLVYIENIVNAAVDEKIGQEKSAMPEEPIAVIKARVARKYIEYYEEKIKKGNSNFVESLAFAQNQLAEALIEMQSA